jgi:hypothetical protein
MPQRLWNRKNKLLITIASTALNSEHVTIILHCVLVLWVGKSNPHYWTLLMGILIFSCHLYLLAPCSHLPRWFFKNKKNSLFLSLCYLKHNH